MRPEDYGIEYGDELTHPDHGEVTVESADEWPLLVVTADGDEVDMFEFQVEQVLDD